ncbi:MAG: amino acid ABC transporter permease [Rhodobacteraceae bacterium]|nr:amino acid ABC transporter permease [Paracoccaceae bacterium]
MSELHAQTALYVRDTMLGQQEPPITERGVVKWLRENLFSGPLNTILTVLALGVIFLIVKDIGPWLLHSVWNASSTAECREIVAATYGEGASGACWGVIRERWAQYLYGFYPPELYWRANLAFIGLFVALAPVLFTSVPRKMLWFTAIYPALAFFLLWGGTIWIPVVILAGFALGWLAFRLLAPTSGTLVAAVATVLVPILWWLFLAGNVANALHSIIPVGLQAVTSDKFGGFLLSFTLGVTGIAFSLPLGIVLALGRQSDMMLVKMLSVGFIEFIRGVPLITLLFTASLLLNYFLPPGTNFDIILRVIILVTLFSAAYIAEVIRGGLAALPRGQYEAADALGLDYWKAQRLIIMPQALKISIPGIVSSFIGLFKDTTLVIFVGLLDPLKGITDAIRGSFEWKGVYWEPFLFPGLLFFLICFGMSRYSMYLERKLKRDHR